VAAWGQRQGSVGEEGRGGVWSLWMGEGGEESVDSLDTLEGRLGYRLTLGFLGRLPLDFRFFPAFCSAN